MGLWKSRWPITSDKNRHKFGRKLGARVSKSRKYVFRPFNNSDLEIVLMSCLNPCDKGPVSQFESTEIIIRNL